MTLNYFMEELQTFQTLHGHELQSEVGFMVCVGSESLMNSCTQGQKRLMFLMKVYAQLYKLNIVSPLSQCQREPGQALSYVSQGSEPLAPSKYQPGLC